MSGIEPSETDRPGDEPSGPSAVRPSVAKPISLADLIAFNEEVVALVRVGLPIEVGLGGAEAPKSIRQITAGFREELRRGSSVRQALDDCGVQFPPSYLAIVEAGLRSNRLNDALVSAGAFARTLLEMQHQIRAALVYPLLIFTIAYGFFLLLLKELVPRINGLVAVSGGTPQPLLQSLEFLSQTMIYWGPILPVLVLFVLLAAGVIPLPFVRPSAALLERIHVLPWVGRIVRDSQMPGSVSSWQSSSTGKYRFPCRLSWLQHQRATAAWPTNVDASRPTCVAAFRSARRCRRPSRCPRLPAGCWPRATIREDSPR